MYFDAKEGLWVARVMVGRRPDGKPDRRKVKAKTQKECRVKLQALREGARTGQLADPHKLTVRDFFTDWLEKTVKVRRDHGP